MCWMRRKARRVRNIQAVRKEVKLLKDLLELSRTSSVGVTCGWATEEYYCDSCALAGASRCTCAWLADKQAGERR